MTRTHITVVLLLYFTVTCVSLGTAGSGVQKPVVTSNLSEEKTKPSGESNASANVPAAIEWTDVAIKAAEVDKLLRTVPEKLPPKSSVKND